MASDLTSSQVAGWLDRLQRSAIKPECRSCDCYLGLLTQLQLDVAEDVSALLQPLKPQEAIHGCLGCDPCPPGALFANYLRGPLQLRLRM